MITDNLTHLATDINKPQLDPANARHNHDLNGIAKSLDKYGQRKPIVVNRRNNIVLAGNGTLKAARQLGWAEIAVVWVDDDSETATGYALADNRLTDLSEFDNEALLASLQQFEDITEIPGFDEFDFEALLAEVGGDLDFGGLGGEELIEDDPPIDKAEELQQVWQVQEGDIWLLGKHRLICGDCTDRAVIDRLMGGEKMNVVVTSPPYAMQRKDTYGGVPTDKYIEWWQGVQSVVSSVLADDGSFFVNIKPHSEDGQRVLYVFDLVLAMVREWGWRFVDEFCWVRKSGPKEPYIKFKNWFEPVYHFSKIKVAKMRPDNVVVEFSDNINVDNLATYGDDSGKWKIKNNSSKGRNVKSKNINGAYPSNVIDTRAVGEYAQYQAATYPVKLPTFFIKAYSDPNDKIFDPFMGSGTTLVAAHNEGRIGFGTERLPKYCAVILQRYADLTGETPTKKPR